MGLSRELSKLLTSARTLILGSQSVTGFIILTNERASFHPNLLGKRDWLLQEYGKILQRRGQKFSIPLFLEALKQKHGERSCFMNFKKNSKKIMFILFHFVRNIYQFFDTLNILH